MKSRGRVLVLAVSLPVIAFAVIGGFMSNAIARQDSYQYLRIFEDVVSLILQNYVEDVNVDKVMHGAMHGLADGLDPDSAYLDVNQVKVLDKGETGGAGQVGLEITRQYYLRVIAARDGSPAAKAGLMPGDYIRAIDGQSTRDTTVYEGQRLLRGRPGSKVHLTVLRGNAVEPHEVDLIREELPAAAVKSRIAAPGVGYLRIPEFGKSTPDQIKSEVSSLTKAGAKNIVIDVRGTAFGDADAGIAAARLFVKSGVLAYRQDRGREKEAVSAAAGDGAITLNAVVLTDSGTSSGAEVFAAALAGNKRAQLIGERTLGRAARQKLVRLPDGSGLMLTHLIYLTPSSAAIHEKGLTPDVAVDQPDVEFGQPPAAKDPILDKAIESLSTKAAA
ncbi:MAG TPA: S41 family peptidase [Vicinamibacterales bacterium]|nr:S41 family peptidase [Vicinamibacterales bacterium]